MSAVLFMRCLDTRSQEALYTKKRVERLGCKIILLDLSMGAYKECGGDYSRVEVLKEAGVSSDQASGMRGASENTKTMVRGARSG